MQARKILMFARVHEGNKGVVVYISGSPRLVHLVNISTSALRNPAG